MWRRTASLPGSWEKEVTEAELEKAKLQFSWFMAKHRERAPVAIYTSSDEIRLVDVNVMKSVLFK